MSLKDYVIAIPSYKRPDTLKNQTLRVLKEQKMDPRKIHIFLFKTRIFPENTDFSFPS